MAKKPFPSYRNDDHPSATVSQKHDVEAWTPASVFCKIIHVTTYLYGLCNAFNEDMQRSVMAVVHAAILG